MKTIDWEYCLAVLTITMLIIFIVTVLLAGLASAGGCLIVDVPPGAVLNVHDGDTFQIFSLQPGGLVKVRLEGIDTPELSKKKGEPDEPGAQEARQFTIDWLSKGPFRMVGCGKATLDRTVWRAERGNETLANALRAAGHAKPE